MEFLNIVAKDIFSRFEGKLGEIAVVFPNIRSRIFFNKYLINQTEKPIFCPNYEDINSLFEHSSQLKIADNLMLVSILYDVYTKHYNKDKETKQQETFDEFFSFGQVLLNDFNDIDKCLVDASVLYSNISDLENLQDSFEHLSSEQIEMLNRFFVSIKTNRTELKDNFFSVWSILSDVYSDFKKELRAKGIAYQGMLYRDVVENFDSIASNSYEKLAYIFVGFNVLTPCEEKLFQLLKPKTLFYWDYDKDFFENIGFEATKYIKKNIEKFPQAIEIKNEDREDRAIAILEATTEISQVGYIPSFIDELQKEKWEEPDTAIVFCNETILLPALQAIPASVDRINVTMGFPLNQTPIYDFIFRVIEVLQNGIKEDKLYHKQLISLLEHQYSELIFENIKEIKEQIRREKLFFLQANTIGFEATIKAKENPMQLIEYLLDTIQLIGVKSKSSQQFLAQENLFNEAIFKVFQLLNRLSDLTKSGYLNLSFSTIISIIRQLLSSQSVPFHGEPATGLQLMGMLETRNLDFKNLMIISMNEGIMPKTDIVSSFIPHFIRKSFIMNGIEQQDAISAYYFYRLLQRATKINLIHYSISNKISKSEMSRFIMQMLVEYPQREKIKKITLQNKIFPSLSTNETIEKTPKMIEEIKEKYSIEKLSQTLFFDAISAYVECPLKFYFACVREISEPKDFTDELDKRILGNIIHKTLEMIYRQIGGLQIYTTNKRENFFQPFQVKKEQIENYIKNKKLVDELLEVAFEKEFFFQPTKMSSYNGKHIIYFEVAKKFVENILLFDVNNAPFEIIKMEGFENMRLKIFDDLTINIGGYIDRMRKKENTLFIDDYKTSSRSNNVAKSLLEMLDRENHNKHQYMLQAFYYSLIVKENNPHNTITPLLLYLPNLKNNIVPYLTLDKQKIENIKPLLDDFKRMLVETIKEIFDINKPFKANINQKKCSVCKFRNICK